ncbi:Nn.00g089540.m01.CDS01 [Neocucurbitaria sp. VM-36]
MLPQLGGSNESKSTTPRRRVRHRMASFFCTRKSDMSFDGVPIYEQIDDASPLRALSPRATEYDPSSPQKKRRTTSFRKRQSKSSKRATARDSISSTVGDKNHSGVDTRMTGGSGTTGVRKRIVNERNTINTSQAPVRGQIQSGKKDAVTIVGTSGTATSPSSEVTLASLPARKEESGSSEGTFETPMEESKKDGCLAK